MVSWSDIKWALKQFPFGCKSGNELNWMLKDNCPVCIDNPIESLSNREYHEKYPAHHRLELGRVSVYLCDVHLQELKESIDKYIKEDS